MMTKINATDADYWTLAHDIYQNKYLTPGQKFYTDESISNPTQDIIKNHKWETIVSINNKNSDLQAAMVVPADEYDDVVNYHKQPSQAIFVARGTSSARDWETNISELATGHTPQTIEKNYQKAKKTYPEMRNRLEALQKANNNPNNKLNQATKNFVNQGTSEALKVIPNTPSKPANQFIQYDKFVDDNLKKYKPKEYSFTGHSLGGGLSMRQGVRHNAKVVSFAGADSYRTLTEQQKKEVKAGKYDNEITNYRHYGDLVPNVPFDSEDGEQTIGKQQFVASSHINLSPLAVGTAGIAGDAPYGTLAFLGTTIITELGQHLSSAWGPDIFNSNGSIKKEPSKFNSFLPQSLNDFENGFAQMYAGKGGQGEKIKISPSDVGALASRLISVVENEVKTMIQKIEREAEHQFESAYREAKRMAYQIGKDLTSSEIDECLHAAGITHSNMVTKPVQKIRQQTKKLLAAANEVKGTGQKGLGIGGKFTATDNGIGGLFS